VWSRARPGFVHRCELALGFMVTCRAECRAPRRITFGAQTGDRDGRQLAGNSLGIIGYGSIANTSRALQRHSAWRFCRRSFATVSNADIKHCRSKTFLSVRLCCLPAVANESTKFDRQAALAQMRRTLLHQSVRGNLVDEAALSVALRENRIAGAAMDVGRAGIRCRHRIWRSCLMS